MEYYQYFRLDGPPFLPASPSGAVYFSPTHLQGLATLESGLEGDLSGLTMLTGDVGTGKTTLIYSLLQRDYKRARIAHIDDPKLSFLEIMRVVMTQLNLYSPGTTKLDYIKALDHLLELHGKEERIAIVIDEAQVLSDDVLEELRLLSNHGQRDGRSLLQLILVGQPELAERLKKPELRQLNQRISSRGVLMPLNPREGIMYVDCRMNAVRGKVSGIFERHALECLLRRSDGIPRKINMLCYSAMMAAFYAGENKVSYKTAKKTAAEYHDAVAIESRKPGTWPLVVRALIAGAALGSLLISGFVYPDVWSEVLNHTVSFGRANEHTVPTDSRAARHRKGAGSRHEAKAALTPHPLESQASLAPDAAATVAPKSDVAGPAMTPGMPIASTAPTVAAASAGTPKPAAVPEQRSQIIVRYGDTLEKIAIRYFGSESGLNALIAANPQLTDINRLSVGQIIYLPHGITPKASHDQTATAPAVPNAENSPER